MSPYQEDAVSRAKDGALLWLQEHTDAYPRSWAQEGLGTARRGYDMYDDFEAPPIAGYDVLEQDGVVRRMETVIRNGEERVHFEKVK